jgi:nucleoside-diphosphate-sugar epimerase
MSDKVLVTGACGLVGSETVKALVAKGRQVVATDLDTPANRRTAQKFGSAAMRWTDLTDRAATQALLGELEATSDHL